MRAGVGGGRCGGPARGDRLGAAHRGVRGGAWSRRCEPPDWASARGSQGWGSLVPGDLPGEPHLRERARRALPQRPGDCALGTGSVVTTILGGSLTDLFADAARTSAPDTLTATRMVLDTSVLISDPDCITAFPGADTVIPLVVRSEAHTSELQSLIRTSYAVF